MDKRKHKAKEGNSEGRKAIEKVFRENERRAKSTGKSHINKNESKTI